MATAMVEGATAPIDVTTATNGIDKVSIIENALAHHTSITNGDSDTAEPPVDPNHEEFQYLNLIRDILKNGEHRPDR